MIPKYLRVLEALSTGASFNRFEAARDLHDHCLHSTVATIQRKGVPVSRRSETVFGYGGAPTKVRRYWIALEHRDLAKKLLSGEDLGASGLPDLGDLDLPDLGDLDVPDLGPLDLPDLGEAADLDVLAVLAEEV